MGYFSRAFSASALNIIQCTLDAGRGNKEEGKMNHVREVGKEEKNTPAHTQNTCTHAGITLLQM